MSRVCYCELIGWRIPVSPNHSAISHETTPVGILAVIVSGVHIDKLMLMAGFESVDRSARVYTFTVLCRLSSREWETFHFFTLGHWP